MTQFKQTLLTAILVLATTFTLSCSSGDDNDNGGNSVAVSSSSSKPISSSSILDVEKSSSSQNADVSSSSAGYSSNSSSSKNTDSSSSSLNVEKSSSSINANVSSSSIEPGEGLMYWGFLANNDPAIIVEWFDWHINEGLIKSSSIAGTVEEIQFPAGSGHLTLLIPQSAGVPTRIDDAIGNNVKETAFVPVSNITIKGTPYYLFIGNNQLLNTGTGILMLTIKW
ncbi:MAG: hypothetical protein LBC87_02065 [Fibromonadaceae bacterium]|jgi:hypothetical protein|nr:hypothetical protein [Fibromonadaceae bacterium]